MAFAKIIPGTDSNFKSAINSRQIGTGYVEMKMPLPAATSSINKMKQQASLATTASGLDMARNAPLYNDPRYTSSTLAIPTDERSLHGLYRFFAETDPITGSSLKVLSELPLASLKLGQCEDTGVQQHYEEMWERINGFKLLSEAVAEYYEIGNVTLFGAYNEGDYMWDQFSILNPDYVKIESTWINERPLIKLVPDEILKKIVSTQSPRALYDQIPDEVKRYVLFKQEIPLDPNNTFTLSHAKRPYETKGRSVIKRILKILMLEDRFNQANFALATRHAVPLTVVKVGDPNMNWLPDQADLDAMRDWLATWEMDPNSSLVYHPGINIEYYGANGRTLPIGPELDRIYRLKFIGLGIHEQLLSGQGGSYSQAYISLEVQRQRYLNLQLKLEQMVHAGMFKPIAEICGFYRIRNAVSGYAGIKKVKFGGEDHTLEELQKNYKLASEYKNPDFQEFMKRKTAEYQQNQQKLTKEYVYPKLDFGALSAAYDENNKNYIKWLVEKRPELIDDGTLLRLAKLDRDDQLKSKISDVERMQEFYAELTQKGLLPFFLQMTGKKGGAGGGMGDMGGGMGGIDMGGLGGGGGAGAGMGGEEGGPAGGEPPLPAGAGGEPEAAQGTAAPGGMPQASLEKELRSLSFTDDILLMRDNVQLINKKNRGEF